MKAIQFKHVPFAIFALLFIANTAICRPARQSRGILSAFLNRGNRNEPSNRPRGRYATRYFGKPQKRQEFDDDDTGTGQSNALGDVPIDAPDGTNNEAQSGYFYYVPASDWEGEVSTLDRIRAYDLPIRPDELQEICDNVSAAYCPNSIPFLRSAFIRTIVFSFLSDVLADASRR